ncbi:hypothetical protein LTR27_009297 [Elasticomyces elasticus]|nr:hypothetical protein LTR27_009297 [Elasticomyces elasticus]
MDNYADYNCKDALSKKHENHYRLESGKGCKTFSEPIKSYHLHFVQRRFDDKPDDWLCDLEVFAEPKCSGYKHTLNATSWLGACVHMEGEPDAFRMQSFRIEFSGGNGWDDGSAMGPWEAVASCRKHGPQEESNASRCLLAHDRSHDVQNPQATAAPNSATSQSFKFESLLRRELLQLPW